MDMKPGYRQTEIGVMPEQWGATRLGKHATFKTGPFGSALHRSDYVYDGIPVVNPMQIVDGKIIPTASMAISTSAARKLTEFRLEKGDVVIGRRGEMGRCAYVRDEENGWLCGTGSMIVRTGPLLDAQFVQRVLSSRPVIRAIENNSVGSTMINLNQATLGNLTIPLPPTIAEQQAISEALGDADMLIASLEKILEKTKLLKRGSIHELLNCQRRLPGFDGDWDVRRLGSFATLQRGFDLPFRARKQGAVPIVTSSGADDTHSEAKARGPGVVTGRYGTIGKVFFLEEDFWPLNTTLYVRDFHGNDPLFISYLLGTIDFHTHSGKSGVPGVNRNDLHEIVVQVPKTKGEQEAIAAILKDIDGEITALNDNLGKVIQLKHGMMQELLTGRVRLV